MRKYLATFIVLAIALTLILPLGSANAQDSSIAVLLDDRDDLSTSALVVGNAGLIDTLNNPGPFTVFAPTDQAWNAALDELNTTEESLLLNNDLLASLATYHVVRGEFTADDLQDSNFLITQNRENVAVDSDGENITINGDADVSRTIPATNGIIYVVDSVLLPPSVTGEPEAPIANVMDFIASEDRFGMTYDAIEGTGLLDTLSSTDSYTLFAPTNAAWNAALDDLNMTQEALLEDNDMLSRVMSYHLVVGEFTEEELYDNNFLVSQSTENISIDSDGDTITLNHGEATVTESMMTSNGVIHVIDGVLLPPAITGDPNRMVTNTADYLASDERFSITGEAFLNAGLIDILLDEQSYTVFAPTDAAWNAALDDLNLDEEEFMANSDLLADLTAYHVVVGMFTVDDLREENFLVAQSTEQIAIDVQSDMQDSSMQRNAIVLNEGQATITESIHTSNGVIHVIDAVLMPSSQQ